MGAARSFGPPAFAAFGRKPEPRRAPPSLRQSDGPPVSFARQQALRDRLSSVTAKALFDFEAIRARRNEERVAQGALKISSFGALKISSLARAALASKNLNVTLNSLAGTPDGKRGLLARPRRSLGAVRLMVTEADCERMDEERGGEADEAKIALLLVVQYPLGIVGAPLMLP